MALVVAFGLVLATVGVFVVAVARERGPGPDQTAIAFHLARDRRDFGTLFDLCGAELRGGLDRAAFVATQHDRHATDDASPPGRLIVRIETVDAAADIAHVTTLLERPEGTERDGIVVERRNGRWLVTRHGTGTDGDLGPDRTNEA